MTESEKSFVYDIIDEVGKRKDIYVSIFIGPAGTSISVYPYDEENE